MAILLHFIGGARPAIMLRLNLIAEYINIITRLCRCARGLGELTQLGLHCIQKIKTRYQVATEED
jgi:hypothetical protein